MTEPGAQFPTDAAEQLQAAVPTATLVLSDPKTFFGRMPKEGGYEAPGAFALAMLVAEAVVLAVMALVHLYPGGFFVSLIGVPIFGAIGLGIGAAILMFLSNALGGEASFESSFRIVAYASAIAPVQAVAQIIPYLPILVSAYGFYLAIVAVVAVHGVEEGKAWRVLGSLAAVLLLFMFMGTVSARRMSARLENLQPELDELSKKMQKQADEMQKAAEKMQHDLQQHRAGEER